MPKGNIIGNRKLRHGKTGSPYSNVSSKVDRSLAGLVGFAAMRSKVMHDRRAEGDKYRLTRDILVYCMAKHNKKSVSELSKMYRMTTDQVRRTLHTTKRMFAKWKGEE